MSALIQKADMRTKAPEELSRPGQLGPSVVALARAREIRTLSNWRCKSSLWQLAFLNHTETTKYEALEKNAVSEPKTHQVANLQYS